jgi:hypothetical protein
MQVVGGGRRAACGRGEEDNDAGWAIRTFLFSIEPTWSHNVGISRGYIRWLVGLKNFTINVDEPEAFTIQGA